MLYNDYYTPDGQPAKKAISSTHRSRSAATISLYRYKPDGEPADYFEHAARAPEACSMKTPVDGARITSGFGMRFHPVLGYTACTKAWISAYQSEPGDGGGLGVVRQEGRLGGYGNFMLVDHQNGYSTAYGHLSRFAPGIHVGSRVRQGQVIAYSGNTGMSTGTASALRNPGSRHAGRILRP